MKKLWKSFRALLAAGQSDLSSEVPISDIEAAIVAGTAKEEEGSHSYSADHPIATLAEDRFNRWPFASRIADTLATRADPSSVVVGIYGPWGDGKTSVLGLMETALKAYSNVVIVRFNPWYFSTQDALLRGFFGTLADAIGGRLTTRKEQVGELLKKYGGILSLASVSVSSGLFQINPGEAASKLGEGLSTAELDDLKARLEKILKETGTRVIVMIDDIDRLDRDEIHAIFKLVKLSAGFEYTSYVLAFDDEVVADSLGSRYGAGSTEAGRAFLEKIVQVPLHLPAADSTELRMLAFSGVDAALDRSKIELSSEEAEAFGMHFMEGLELRLSTPRQAKLYVNAIKFALPLLQGEVHPVDHMLIEGVRIFYPKLYGVIRDNPDRFLTQDRDGGGNGARNAVDEKIDKALSDLTERDRRQIKGQFLHSLFPRFGNVGYGSDWESRWSREKRICSQEYFARYFAYSVPPGDISDREVESFIQGVSAGEGASATERLDAVAQKRGIQKLIRKLRARESGIDPAIAPKLAEAVLANGALFPREQQMFVPDRTYIQTAFFAVAMVRALPAGADRTTEARRLVALAEPLALGQQFLRWLRKGSEEPEETRVLSEAGEAEVGAVLADRIKAASENAPIYRTQGHDTPSLLWIWQKFGKEEEVSAHLRATLNSFDEAIAFLDVFTGRAWGLETGLSRRSDFGRGNYDNVATLVEPGIIFDLLKSKFGEELENPDYHLSDDEGADRMLAHQFAYAHKGALAPPEASEAPSAGDPDEETEA